MSQIDLDALFDQQAPQLQTMLKRIAQVPFYQERLAAAGLTPEDIRSYKDLEKLPFTTKQDLRETYPLGLMAVPEEEVARIHSSSGTTGKPVIIPYTAKDLKDWAIMMARCMEMAGVNTRDRVQITPGYGLWTAGIGFQAGVEHLGAMAVPTGPGNTEKQLEMMVDLQSTVLIGTSSYALFLAEEIQRRGLRDQVTLKKGIIGSERWSDKMRLRIEEILDIESFDIYGLTEIYGPGIGLDCSHHQGIHIWTDYLLLEIIDPETGKQLPPGQEGELVITTIAKEGMPLLRYRTRDITTLIPETCPCGSPFPMIKRILGRSDDMIKVKGVNIYPGQIDFVLQNTPGVCSEYQILLERRDGKDDLLIRVEEQKGSREEDRPRLQKSCMKNIKAKIGILVNVEIVEHGGLPRSEKKTKRVFDNRDPA